MYTWLGCIVAGTLTVIYAVTHTPMHSSTAVTRMEALATAGFLLLLLGVIMISWRFITVMSPLPK